VGVGVTKGVGVAVGVGVTKGVGVAVGVGVTKGVGVGVGVVPQSGVGVGVGVGVKPQPGVGVGVGQKVQVLVESWPAPVMVPTAEEFPPGRMSEEPQDRSGRIPSPATQNSFHIRVFTH
jgi:hypothetical protein